MNGLIYTLTRPATSGDVAVAFVWGFAIGAILFT